MKLLLSKRVHAAWTMMALVLCGAVAVGWMVVQNAPPSNSVLVTSSENTGAGGNTSMQNDRSTRSAQQSTSNLAQASAAPPSIPPATREAGSMVPNNGLDDRVPTAIEGISIPTSTPEMIEIYVSGAVHKPGVYTLTVGSRVADALSAAGGPADGASLDNLNLAQRLTDEEHVAVPRIGDTPVPLSASGMDGTTGQANTSPQQRTPASGASQAPKPTPIGRININTASAEELDALPGIGPSLAGKIIAYRNANGSFQSIEDIMKVPGIKQGLFSQIRDHIMVGP